MGKEYPSKADVQTILCHRSEQVGAIRFDSKTLSYSRAHGHEIDFLLPFNMHWERGELVMRTSKGIFVPFQIMEKI